MYSVPKNLSSVVNYLTFKLCNNLLNLGQLQQIHAKILINDFLDLKPLIIKFLTSCHQSNKPSYALTFLRNLPLPDPYLWNLALQVSLDHGFGPDFLRFYNGMLYNFMVPDKSVFISILRSCSALRVKKMGEVFHTHILKMGFGFNLFVQTGLLDFYGKIGDLKSVELVFSEIPKKDVVVNNAVISALGMHGYVNEARKLFEKLTEKKTSSWNSMISLYCKSGDINSARLLFDSNPVKDLVTWNTMIDGYCKSNNLTAAQDLFTKMGSAKNSTTWNTMISGFVQSGEFGRSISIFQEMQDENVKPTGVTMVSLLSACAHLGALNMGEWIHTHIRRKRLKIDVVLGNALIDMYCKCGRIEPALDVFHDIPMKNIFCWNSIIVGLGMHGFGNEAIRIFSMMENEKIFPDKVTFVGLLSGCSHSGLVSAGKEYFSRMHVVYGVKPEIEHYGCMVDLLCRAGFLKEALELVKLMPMKPNSIVLGSLFRSCQIHNDTELSEQVTQHLLEFDPTDCGNYVFLSNVYAALKRWGDVDVCRKLMIEKRVRKLPGYSSVVVGNIVHEFVAGDTSHEQFEQINVFLDEITRVLKSNGYKTNAEDVMYEIEEDRESTLV